MTVAPPEYDLGTIEALDFDAEIPCDPCMDLPEEDRRVAIAEVTVSFDCCPRDVVGAMCGDCIMTTAQVTVTGISDCGMCGTNIKFGTNASIDVVYFKDRS